jgi:DNA-binding protein HU-beta
MSISKSDLIKQVANTSIYSQTQVQEIIDLTLTAIRDALKQGDSIALVGFGTFTAKDRPARMGRNPATGASINIPASVAVKFKPAKTFLG